MPVATELSKTPIAKGRPDYGIDAPGVVRTFLISGTLGVLIGVGGFFAAKNGFWQAGRFFVWPLISIGVTLLAQGGVMVWGSKCGKLLLRDKVLSKISWRGNETVLDVGCGHGLMLIGAAKKLRTGRAIGIDLWQKEDQAGNSREATWRNVELENVAEHVELKDGDARKLPFTDNTFDVILSSWALHNIYDATGRETAIREIVRVLKPGGRVTIVDIRHSAEYAEIFRQAGMSDVKRTGPNFLFVIPSFMVSATKSSE